jgi:hypothetical protein
VLDVCIVVCDGLKGLPDAFDATCPFALVQTCVLHLIRNTSASHPWVVTAYKLIIAAQDRWRAINGPHLVALVRAGATFKKGVLVENPNEVAA